MTLPSVSKDLLMAAPSFNRVPADPAVLAFSEPAKSTKFTCSLVWWLRAGVVAGAVLLLAVVVLTYKEVSL